LARIFKPSQSSRGKTAQKSAEKAPKQLSIESLSPEGRGVARHQGKAVFVTGGLPGETVEISHYQRNKRFSECRVKRVVEPSPYRVTPPCAHFYECGGCELQHLDIHEQLALKQQSLLDALAHHLPDNAVFDVLPPITSSECYRSRARIGVSRDGKLGFRARQSEQLIAVDNCLVLEPQLQQLWPLLQLWLDGFSDASGVTHIELISAALKKGDDLGAGIVIRHIRSLQNEHRERLAELLKTAEIPVACLLLGEKGGEPVPLLDEEGPDFSYCLLDDQVRLNFKPADFTQVNRGVNQQMVAQSLEWLALEKSDRVLDLFCGIGNFTLPMALQAGEVVGIEGVEAMVQRGRDNAELNGLDNVHFKALNLDQPDLGRALQRQQANKFLLDPPRSGAKFICEQMGLTDCESGVYVSCNPASLVRDAVILAQQGFELRALRVLDMFPHTAHLEAMALFGVKRHKQSSINKK
jgi:23S rRNA (uracil1939-C5)-methyltransferase